MFDRLLPLVGATFFLFSSFTSANASEFRIQFETGESWKMTDSLEEEFKFFLDEKIQTIKNQIPDLYWPEINSQTKFKDVFMTSFYPGSDQYRNRAVQCSFIKRVLDNTKGEVHEQFASITNQGKICIQFDLPKSEWTEFTARLMDFFWTQKWILLDNKNLSLEDLAKNAFGEKYRRPEFYIATEIEYDAYGWGYSQQELEIFNNSPVLSKYNDLIQQYDPNSTSPFTLLGPQVEELLSDNQYGMAGSFQPGSKVYIANAIGPADLVEFLVHEYGHVFHGESSSSLSWDIETKKLSVKSNRVHDESVAESMAWMLLRDVYDNYPEIQFEHLAKLQLFLHTRPRDPHLIGAAAVYELFHSDNDGTFKDLREYAEASDLGSYLLNHGFGSNLESLGRNPLSEISVDY